MDNVKDNTCYIQKVRKDLEIIVTHMRNGVIISCSFLQQLLIRSILKM